MKPPTNPIETVILRDLKSGQSTVDAIAMRFGLTAQAVQSVMNRLEREKRVLSKPICNGKYTVYELR